MKRYRVHFDALPLVVKLLAAHEVEWTIVQAYPISVELELDPSTAKGAYPMRDKAWERGLRFEGETITMVKRLIEADDALFRAL